jgi:hypothetical protein
LEQKWKKNTTTQLLSNDQWLTTKQNND